MDHGTNETIVKNALFQRCFSLVKEKTKFILKSPFARVQKTMNEIKR